MNLNRKVFRFCCLIPLLLVLQGAALPPITTDEGRRQWHELKQNFIKSKSPKLVTKAFQGALEGRKSAIEKSIALYDLLKIDPRAFSTGAFNYDNSLNCPAQILVPRTQFIPFKQVKDLLKKAGDTKEAKLLRKRVSEYYAFVEKKRPAPEKLKCKLGRPISK